MDLLPPHIYNIRFVASLRSLQLNRKYTSLKKNYQKRLLNLEIKDIHSQVNYIKIRLEEMEIYLRSKIPVNLLKNFFESNNNKFNNYNKAIKTKLINKLNKIKIWRHENINNFCNMDTSKCIVNNSDKELPDYALNILSLGERFGLPCNNKDRKERAEINLSVIKNFEASSYTFPENVLDKMRPGIVNMLSKNTYSNKHMNYMDSYILREFNKCKNFLKNNEDLMITKADKGQITVILNKSKYVEQMTKALDDDRTYKKTFKDPLKTITNKTNNMLKMWRDNKIIDDPMYKGLRCTNGNLPRCYGLPEVHKEGFPLRIVVSSVRSPLV